MSERGAPVSDEQALVWLVEDLLADPLHRDNPLHEPLARMLEMNRAQTERMERLVKISDGYHGLARDHSAGLADKFDRQVRRLTKLARISDLYQRDLRELSETLREASLKDPLTGLGNRRFLTERLKEEVERANRKQLPLSIAILDVDHFKAINDVYGHEVGDRALCSIAEAMRRAVREYDIVGRWGGEEFLLLFPETGAQEAVSTAERVREGVATTQIEGPRDTPIRLLASLGVTVYQPGEPPSATIIRADNALFAAKNGGRNCTVML